VVPGCGGSLPETTLSGGSAMDSAEKEKLFAKVSAYQMKSFPRFETSVFQHISERSL